MSDLVRVVTDKATCPACDSCTSGIARAFRDGESCPHCDLPADAAAAVLAAQERGASEDLVTRAAKAEQRAAAAEAEAGRLRGVLRRARRVLDEEAS